MLIDTHCHLDDEKYQSDRQETIERAHQAGVSAMISIGCDLTTSSSAQAVAKQHETVYFSAGIHPHESGKAPSNYLEVLRSIASDKKCVAIGECGLDYYYNHSEPATQQRVFKEQVQLAQELNKALVVHVRDAWDDCLDILLDRSPHLSTVIHCFSGPPEFAEHCWKRGYYLSFSGIVTFKKAVELLEIAKNTPIEQLLIETDAPYLTPEPYRGKRNEPAFVAQIAKKIARARELSNEELSLRTTQNAQRCFGI